MGARISSSQRGAAEALPGSALPPGHQGRACTEQGRHQRCSDLQPSPGIHVLVNSPAGAGHHSLTKGPLLLEVTACLRQRKALITTVCPLFPFPWALLHPSGRCLYLGHASPQGCNGRDWSPAPKSTLLQPKSPHCPGPWHPGPAPAPSQPLCHPTPFPRLGLRRTTPVHQVLFCRQSRRLSNAHPTNKTTVHTCWTLC